MGKFVGKNSRVAAISSLGIEHRTVVDPRCYSSLANSALACFRAGVRHACYAVAMANGVPRQRSQTCEPRRASPILGSGLHDPE